MKKAGYRWLPRAQKPKYSKAAMLLRVKFCNKIIRWASKVWKEEIAFSTDGVILPRPPSDPEERHNHCFSGITHMWRKPGETAKPELAGEDPYASQIPLKRALPLWVGISTSGVAELICHKTKKCQIAEWVGVIDSGKMSAAVKRLQPENKKGPWTILCDGEHFLTAKDCKAAYKKKKINVLKVPPKSPDLNPIEKFWGWLRRELRLRDLNDFQNKKPVLGKIAFKARVRNLLKTKKTQAIAGRFARDLVKVCKEVKKKGGAAARG